MFQNTCCQHAVLDVCMLENARHYASGARPPRHWDLLGLTWIWLELLRIAGDRLDLGRNGAQWGLLGFSPACLVSEKLARI